jgi:hypothetical protein
MHIPCINVPFSVDSLSRYGRIVYQSVLVCYFMSELYETGKTK